MNQAAAADTAGNDNDAYIRSVDGYRYSLDYKNYSDKVLIYTGR